MPKHSTAFSRWLAQRFERSEGNPTPPRKGDVAAAAGLPGPRISDYLHRGRYPQASQIDGLVRALRLSDADVRGMLAALAAKGAA